MGVVHDDWQQGLGRAILAKRDTGLYAAGIGGVFLSTCRQVGKTFTLGTLIFALCILLPKTTVLWTAHHTKTSDETFETLAALARRPQIAPYVSRITLGNGKQSIRFTNGSRILFGAREHGFGRGIPGVTIVVFDEAQILKQSALNDMVPAANTVRNPLILYMGTPPDPKDPAEVFKARRREALRIEKQRDAGEEVPSNALYVEIGASDGADLNDRDEWENGNPSYPDRTPAESIMRLREQLGDDEAFAREGLGIWDSDETGSRLITAEEWSATAVTEAPTEGLRAFAVTFNQDGSRAAIAGALKHADGVHVELIGAQSGAVDLGVAPLAKWLTASVNGEPRWKRVAEIAISGRAGSSALVQALKDRGVPDRVVHVVSTPEYLASCSMLLDGVRDGSITHPLADDGDELDASVAVTDKKKRAADGAWGFSATTPEGDETPVEAVAVANWRVRTTKRRPGRKQVLL